MKEPEKQPLVEVAFQHREGDAFHCDICPRHCVLMEGDIGTCGGRQVIGDRLIAINYAQVSALHLDPIEKKPLYHFFPGSDILSVGPNGCNLTCPWCQNWQISQEKHTTRSVLPDELADMVDALDGIGVAYTYAEPLIWFEYVRDAGKIFHERGLVNVFVSNGYINPEPLKEILKIADAFNIDLKTTEEEVFRHYCGASLEEVKRNIKMIYDAGRHLEITHLMITDINDDLTKVEQLAKWIASVDRRIPLHLTRFRPAHLYEHRETDVSFLQKALQLSRSYLDNVYLGNVAIADGQDTRCAVCGTVQVKRQNYGVEITGLRGNHCSNCGAQAYFKVDIASLSDSSCNIS